MAGNPVPAFGGDEGGAVEAHGAAVFAGAALDGLLLRDAGVRRRGDADGEGIETLCSQECGYVEGSADEGALDVAETLAVEPDLRRVVDAVEGDGLMLAGGGGGSFELDAVPVVLLVERLRDGEIVEAVVGVGIESAVDHAGEDGARNGGVHPGGVGEAGGGEGCAGDGDGGGGGELPARAQGPGLIAYGEEDGGVRGGQRLHDGLAVGRERGRHERGVLGLLVAGLGADLDGPGEGRVVPAHGVGLGGLRGLLSESLRGERCGGEGNADEVAAEVLGREVKQVGEGRDDESRGDGAGGERAVGDFPAVDTEALGGAVGGDGEVVPAGLRERACGAEQVISAVTKDETAIAEAEIAGVLLGEVTDAGEQRVAWGGGRQLKPEGERVGAGTGEDLAGRRDRPGEGGAAGEDVHVVGADDALFGHRRGDLYPGTVLCLCVAEGDCGEGGEQDEAMGRRASTAAEALVHANPLEKVGGLAGEVRLNRCFRVSLSITNGRPSLYDPAPGIVNEVGWPRDLDRECAVAGCNRRGECCAMKKILICVCWLVACCVSACALAPVPPEMASTHFVVTIDGQQTPVMHAALNLYFLNFEARKDALITVTADQDGFWAGGAEVQPWRLNIRPVRSGRTLTFHLKGAKKISISRPGDFGSAAEMLYLFANPVEAHPPTATTPGVRYYGPGVHRENIDAAAGDHIYLADGAVVFGSLNVWQVDGVSVSGRGVIVYDGPQNPADDDGWMHKKNWHCIVMDNAHDISIEGITCVVRSRTWQIQMKDSRRIVYDNIKVIGANDGNANADGMDWLGGGDTVVRDSFFRAADDVFALQTSWDGYGPEAFSHQGKPVTNITIERGVFSTSISNIVRAGWPEKNFEGGNFKMHDADVIHMGLGGCGIPFALMELWADPNGRGQSAGFQFDNVRMEDWYSLTQLMQPTDGVRGVSFQDVNGLETPALVASVLKGSVHDVSFDDSGLAGTPPRDAGGLPLEVRGGADQPKVLGVNPALKISATLGWIRPGSQVKLEAAGGALAGAKLHYHWTFGDGSSADGRQVKHRFPDTDGTLLDGSGRFRVLLEATTEDGRHERAYLPVTVSTSLRPAVIAAAAIPGISYAYQGPDGSHGGVAASLALASVPHADTDYSVSFDGYVQAPADGGYRFWMVANEAAAIELDGERIAVNKAPIVQVCGLTGMAAQSISGTASLAHGPHHLRVTETHNKGKDDFRLLWQGPGFELQPIDGTAVTHIESAEKTALAN